MEHFKQGDKIEIEDEDEFGVLFNFKGTFIAYYENQYIFKLDNGFIGASKNIKHIKTKDEQIKLLKAEYLQKMEQLIDELNDKISKL